MIILDNKSKVPIYKQVYLKIEERIALGVLKPNEQLPPIRTLAIDLTINPNTVAKAYNMLENAGLIYVLPTKGYFVSDENESVIEKILSTERDEITAHITKSRTLGLSKQALLEIVEKVYEEGSK